MSFSTVYNSWGGSEWVETHYPLIPAAIFVVWTYVRTGQCIAELLRRDQDTDSEVAAAGADSEVDAAHMHRPQNLPPGRPSHPGGSGSDSDEHLGPTRHCRPNDTRPMKMVPANVRVTPGYWGAISRGEHPGPTTHAHVVAQSPPEELYERPPSYEEAVSRSRDEHPVPTRDYRSGDNAFMYPDIGSDYESH